MTLLNDVVVPDYHGVPVEALRERTSQDWTFIRDPFGEYLC